MTALVIAGFIGAAVIVVVYFCNQQGWLVATDWRYPAGNFVGAVLIFASLFAQWNFPSAIIEGFWILISVYGLVRIRSRGA